MLVRLTSARPPFHGDVTILEIRRETFSMGVYSENVFEGSWVHEYTLPSVCRFKPAFCVAV